MARRFARRLAHAGLLPLTAIGALTLSACDGAADTPPPASAATTPGLPTAAGGTPTGTDSGSDPGSAAPGSARTLPAGTHDGYVTSVDPAKRTVSFDKVEILTGDAAVKAFQKENPGVTEGPPNDYFMVDDNKLVRTLPVSDGVTVAVVDVLTGDSVDPVPSSFAKLPAFLAVKDNSTLFKLTVENGEVTAMTGIYLP